MTLNERNTSVSLTVIGQKFKILDESQIELILRGLRAEAPVGMET
uniref:Uncharacterized protein n=1 Tax=Romanomermis culicivorax TaxID=13658 RepID=A0A915HK77_ROMCU